MSYSFSTGSEDLRDTEILKYWQVFEPMTDERFALSGGIYSVPIGQVDPCTFTVATGSLAHSGDYIFLEKERHIFDHENQASQFILEIGVENIISYYEREFMISPGVTKLQYVIELINHPTFEIDVLEQNYEPTKGYRIEVFKEDGTVLEKMDREIQEDILRGILTEPFLRYFDLRDSS